MATFNAQTASARLRRDWSSTSNFGIDLDRTRLRLRRSRSYGPVDSTDDDASHDHLDKTADADQHEKLCWEWLRRVNRATCADREDLDHDSKANA